MLQRLLVEGHVFPFCWEKPPTCALPPISPRSSQGAPAADDFFMALAMDPASVLANGEWWRLGSSTLLHAGMLHLTLNCWALSFVGVEAEAVLG